MEPSDSMLLMSLLQQTPQRMIRDKVLAIQYCLR